MLLLSQGNDSRTTETVTCGLPGCYRPRIRQRANHMCAVVLDEPRIIHSLPGRIRVHLPEWDGGGESWVERQVRELPGVRSAQASRLTGNVLIHFDPSATGADRLLGQLHRLGPPPPEESQEMEEVPRVHLERQGGVQRARIAVRGLDRDPALVQAIEARLNRLPGVRASASTLTGRLVVEWSRTDIRVEDLVSEVSQIELPRLAAERRPAHPLDTQPLVQSLVRLAGATVGLGLLALRRMLGLTGPPIASAVPLVIADVISILRSFPLTRNGVRRLLGRQAADTVFSTAFNLSLTAADLPLGLALTQAEGLEAVH
jgi:cation-transporting ATPase I